MGNSPVPTQRPVTRSFDFFFDLRLNKRLSKQPWGLWFYVVNTLRPRQNGRQFPDDIFKRIFLNEYVWILIQISLKFVPKRAINNFPAMNSSDNGLAPIRRQAIIWTNDGSITDAYMRHSASMSFLSLMSGVLWCIASMKAISHPGIEFQIRMNKILKNMSHFNVLHQNAVCNTSTEIIMGMITLQCNVVSHWLRHTRIDPCDTLPDQDEKLIKPMSAAHLVHTLLWFCCGVVLTHFT